MFRGNCLQRFDKLLFKDMKLLDFTGRKVDPSLLMGFKENKKEEDPNIKVSSKKKKSEKDIKII